METEVVEQAVPFPPAEPHSSEELLPEPATDFQPPSQPDVEMDASASSPAEIDTKGNEPAVEDTDSHGKDDDGHISDDGEVEEAAEQERLHGLQPIRSSPSSSDDEDGKPQKTRLERLKNLRFAAPSHKKFSAGRPQRRTVRSFLDEKLAPEEPEVAHHVGNVRSRRRSHSPEEKKERHHHHQRKRRHDDEDRERRKEKQEKVVQGQHAAASLNPQTITQKVQTILARCEGPCDIAEDELRSIVMETVVLEQELQAMFDKRQNLAKEMEDMAAQEKETIKKVHSSLPAHMQTVLKFDGNKIDINDAPVLNPALGMPPFPPGMFPPIPSMLAGMPPFPQGMPFPPLGPNGVPLFPFPGMFPPERSNSPGAEVPEIKNGTQTPPDQVQWTSDANAVPKVDGKPSSPFDIAWSSSTVNFSATFHEVPPAGNEVHQIDFSKPPPMGNTNNGSTSSLPDLAKPPPIFNIPPPSFLVEKEEGANNARSGFQGQSQKPGADLCKTITSLITNAIKAPSAFNTPPPPLMNPSLLGPPPGRSSSPMLPPRPNPPSLMSIPTKDPYNIGVRMGFKHKPKRHHGGRAGRELRDHTASPR